MTLICVLVSLTRLAKGIGGGGPYLLGLVEAENDLFFFLLSRMLKRLT